MFLSYQLLVQINNKMIFIIINCLKKLEEKKLNAELWEIEERMKEEQLQKELQKIRDQKIREKVLNSR